MVLIIMLTNNPRPGDSLDKSATQRCGEYEGTVVEVDVRGQGKFACVLFDGRSDSEGKFTGLIPRTPLIEAEALYEGTRIRCTINGPTVSDISNIQVLPMTEEEWPIPDIKEEDLAGLDPPGYPNDLSER